MTIRGGTPSWSRSTSGPAASRASTPCGRRAPSGCGREHAPHGPDPAGHDLVVNPTSLGMRPGDALPLEAGALGPGMLAAEVVIRPETTPFLAEASRRGCAVHCGEPMLTAQIDLMIDFMLP